MNSLPGSGFGSSPLARGLRHEGACRLPRPGIIPARAGFTPPRRRRSGPGRDHPRSRGVYAGRAPHISRTVGSSPLARGLRGVHALEHCGQRIIPARAGFTSPSAAPPARIRDHPRSRGVYSPIPSPALSISGSSPLARGLPVGQARRDRRDRDHPRSRGVYGTIPNPLEPRGGSSPLARGLPHDGAGRARRPRDHPRSRGVYPPGIWGGARSAGSSPLARGLPDAASQVHDQDGIIPARAGFTAHGH